MTPPKKKKKSNKKIKVRVCTCGGRTTRRHSYCAIFLGAGRLAYAASCQIQDTWIFVCLWCGSVNRLQARESYLDFACVPV